MFKAVQKVVHVSIPSKQYLTFTLGKEVFGIDILVVKEIIQYTEISGVPMMPDYIRGIINLRGAVVPVIDMHVRFGHAAAQVGKRSCIIILEVVVQGKTFIIGAMVDAVSAVIDVPDQQIEAPPRFGNQARNEFISGIGKIDEQFIIILNINKTFSIEELEAMSSAIEAT
jgi:purine-binding chemotaxis protein CheW